MTEVERKKFLREWEWTGREKEWVFKVKSQYAADITLEQRRCLVCTSVLNDMIVFKTVVWHIASDEWDFCLACYNDHMARFFNIGNECNDSEKVSALFDFLGKFSSVGRVDDAE